jgi:hypothetical protein
MSLRILCSMMRAVMASLATNALNDIVFTSVFAKYVCHPANYSLHRGDNLQLLSLHQEELSAQLIF